MLKPIEPGTDRPKTLAEMTPGELNHCASQIFDDQLENLRHGWPTDQAALDHADEIITKHGDEELRQKRDSFAGFRMVKEGDKAFLSMKLAEAEREIARLSKAK